MILDRATLQEIADAAHQERRQCPDKFTSLMWRELSEDAEALRRRLLEQSPDVEQARTPGCVPCRRQMEARLLGWECPDCGTYLDARTGKVSCKP